MKKGEDMGNKVEKRKNWKNKRKKGKHENKGEVWRRGKGKKRKTCEKRSKKGKTKGK